MHPGANLGYARAANLGIAATDAPVVAVCNPDPEVKPGAAGALVRRFAAEPDLGGRRPADLQPRRHHLPVGPLRSRGPGRGRPRAARARLAHQSVHAAYRQLDADPSRPATSTGSRAPRSGCGATRSTTVGGWDERFFMYVEDVDLCWQLRQRGWRVGYEPGAVVTHVQGATTAKHPYRMIAEHHRSLYRFASKRWRGARRLALPVAAAFLALRAALAMADHALRRRPRPPQVTG